MVFQNTPIIYMHPVVEYEKLSITFDESVPYEITTKNEKLFMGYVEGSICGLGYTTLKRKSQTTFRESPKQNFERCAQQFRC
jgi:hypothetical protein